MGSIALAGHSDRLEDRVTADREADAPGSEVQLLPGMTSNKLKARGLITMVVTGGIGISLIAVEHYLPGSETVWKAVLGSGGAVGVLGGGAMVMQGQDKAHKEVAVGYTTNPETAQSNPALYVFDWRSKQLISSPRTPPQTN